jgi:hypothetical protein
MSQNVGCQCRIIVVDYSWNKKTLLHPCPLQIRKGRVEAGVDVHEWIIKEGKKIKTVVSICWEEISQKKKLRVKLHHM